MPLSRLHEHGVGRELRNACPDAGRLPSAAHHPASHIADSTKKVFFVSAVPKHTYSSVHTSTALTAYRESICPTLLAFRAHPPPDTSRVPTICTSPETAKFSPDVAYQPLGARAEGASTRRHTIHEQFCLGAWQPCHERQRFDPRTT
ncbi:hypothetical protein AC579_5819 [Pseudocercospora musae]|uniref:Uncharacterized protein n=1 Tax=Pseudocercospora musae TaxID=113226 RepID=A0A139I347_9PEZI|nr:hypothetical protein AC579_5819 [Pseudocercospora musae]